MSLIKKLEQKKLKYKDLDEFITQNTKYDNLKQTLNLLEIYNTELNIDVFKTTLFKCPFHKDSNNSFYIDKVRQIHYCHGCNESGNVVTLIQKLYNKDYVSALIYIYNKYVANTSVTSSIRTIQSFTQEDLNFTHIVKPFDNVDKKFWSECFIKSATLEYFGIDSIASVYKNDKLVWNSTNTNPIYFLPAYDVINNCIKNRYYRPYNTEKYNRDSTFKWIGNSNKNCIFGYRELVDREDVLFITKSFKDLMVLFELGLNSIAVVGETHFINEDILNDLKKRFKYIYVFFDTDATGKKFSIKFTNMYNLYYINIPDKYDCKDPSDLIVKTKTTNILNDIIFEKLKRDGIW